MENWPKIDKQSHNSTFSTLPRGDHALSGHAQKYHDCSLWLYIWFYCMHCSKVLYWDLIFPCVIFFFFFFTEIVKFFIYIRFNMFLFFSTQVIWCFYSKWFDFFCMFKLKINVYEVYSGLKKKKSVFYLWGCYIFIPIFLSFFSKPQEGLENWSLSMPSCKLQLQVAEKVSGTSLFKPSFNWHKLVRRNSFAELFRPNN